MVRKTEKRIKSYHEELAEAFYDSMIQNRMEQEGYLNISYEEAYLFKTRSVEFLDDIFAVAFNYSIICAEELKISIDSEFFKEMNIRNRDLLCSKLAKMEYENGDFYRLEILPYVLDYKEEGFMKDFIVRNENYKSLREGLSFKNFIEKYVCYCEAI